MPSSASSSDDKKKKKKKEKLKREKKEAKKAKEEDSKKDRKEEKRRDRSRSRKGKEKKRKEEAKREPSPASADISPPRGGRSTAVDSAPSGLLTAGRSRSRDDGPSGGVALRPLEMLELEGGKGGGKGKGKEGKGKGKEGGEQEPKEEPNFEASGLLAVEDNSKNGVALNFTQPPEARRPTLKWRLYIYTKGTEEPKIVPIHRQIGYLFGKDRRVADIPTDHMTCSKQHAVLHYRLSPKGDVRPYIMDLESKNGTFLNGSKVDGARYTEVREGDALKFGMSTREYVILHAGSANHIKIDEKQLRSDSE